MTSSRWILFSGSNIIFLVFTILYRSPSCSSYNILVSTVSAAASQNLVMYRLADLLGQRGHDVTVLKVDVFKETKSPKLRYVNEEISYPVIPDPIVEEQLRQGFQDNAWNSTGNNIMKLSVVKQFFGQLANSCRNFIANENSVAFQKFQSKKFDAIVIHMADFCSIGLAHKFGIKGTIWMSTAFTVDFMAWYAGAPTPISYVPAGPNPMPTTSFKDRLVNCFAFLAVNAIFQYGVVQTYTDIFQERYGPNFPTFGQLLYRIQLHFINSDPFFEYPRPILHKMIYVGGLTMENPEPLDEKWKKIVDDSKSGIVIFSFGSITNTSFMPVEWKAAFMNAFKRIEQTVIWRLEGDTSLAKGVPNVVIADWLPQRDLMALPNVKALITHGGYNSLTEATYMGVPLLMFPLYGDQYSNCKRVERLNVGIVLQRDNMTTESVYDALTTVINNETIQTNARRLGQMIRKKPHSSKQAAIEWVEFLAEFQDLSQLIPKGQEISLIEYFMIDVFIIVLLFTIVLNFVFFYVLFKFFAKCCRKHRKSKME